MSGTVSDVLYGTALPVEDWEEEFLRVAQDIIETGEERDTFASYQELEDRVYNLLGQFDSDRDDDEDI